MSDALTDRLAVFEAKYANDQDMAFKVAARRNKLFGIWAAEAVGETDVDAYAQTVIASDLKEAGDQDVIRKVHADLDKAGLSYSSKDLALKLSEFEKQAKASFLEG